MFLLGWIGTVMENSIRARTKLVLTLIKMELPIGMKTEFI